MEGVTRKRFAISIFVRSCGNFDCSSDSRGVLSCCYDVRTMLRKGCSRTAKFVARRHIAFGALKARSARNLAPELAPNFFTSSCRLPCDRALGWQLNTIYGDYDSRKSATCFRGTVLHGAGESSLEMSTERRRCNARNAGERSALQLLRNADGTSALQLSKC